jgi:GDPmannose 4,6-dehydratase
MKLALITGITGQDGSYLAELLLEKDYKVYGIVRRTSLLYTHTRLDAFRAKLNLAYGDLTDCFSLNSLLNKIIQDNPGFSAFEIYNLAAQSHVQISFELPDYTTHVDGLGVLHILELIRQLPLGVRDKIKFYQAGTSEMFGEVREIPQKETTPFNPRSPYACAKAYAHYLCRTYRDAYGMFICNGILFNHESPRRGDNFVTMKIVNGVKRIARGENKSPIRLGNLHSLRDWGHAKDYVRGMWLMLQKETPDDYVLATGVAISVKEFVVKAFDHAGIQLTWSGEGLEAEARNAEGEVVVCIDPKYFRPCEVDRLLGDASKAQKNLGWQPAFDINAIVEDMMEH